MIRTKTVRLTTMKGFAYRQKLSAGGSGVTIITPKSKQPGIASISKGSGKPIISKNTPKDIFTEEAFIEALELTNGMPYNRLGQPRIVETKDVSEDVKATEHEVPELQDIEVVIDSNEYQKIVDKYTDARGKLNYGLLNKDFIQMAYGSKYIQSLIEKGSTVDDIRTEIVRTKFVDITGNNDLTDAQMNKMVDLLDEVYDKGVFRELNEELRKWLSKSKNI